MDISTKIFVAYYGENLWKLTVNEDEARELDPDYQLASLDDLDDWGCIANYYMGDIIELQEGKFKWVYYEYIDNCGTKDFYGEYELMV